MDANPFSFSPIVAPRLRKAPQPPATATATASTSTTNNPFDDLVAWEGAGAQAPPPAASPVVMFAASYFDEGNSLGRRRDSTASEDDPFGLFAQADDDERERQKQITNEHHHRHHHHHHHRPRVSSKLASQQTSGGESVQADEEQSSEDQAREDDVDDDAERRPRSLDLAEEEKRATPAIPPRTYKTKTWLTHAFVEPPIPTRDPNADDGPWINFLMSPIPTTTKLKMTVRYDAARKLFWLMHDASRSVWLVGQKRTDGLKALSLESNLSVFYIPLIFAGEPGSGGSSNESSMPTPTESFRVAKVRGNAGGSLYSVFDTGKSASRARGVIEVRRELASFRCETVSGIYTRRALTAFVPAPGQFRRPMSKGDMLAERAKKRDFNVRAFSPNLPTTRNLPRLQDYNGFASEHSVKNVILHDTTTSDAPRVVLRFGKVDKTTYNLEFEEPFSCVTAFGLALASIDSKVHPNRQI